MRDALIEAFEVLAVMGIAFVAWVLLYRAVTGHWSTPVPETAPAIEADDVAAHNTVSRS